MISFITSIVAKLILSIFGSILHDHAVRESGIQDEKAIANATALAGAEHAQQVISSVNTMSHAELINDYAKLRGQIATASGSNS